MARGGSIEFDVKVNVYYQACPVCGGRGTVPNDFYDCRGVGTSTSREQCRRCVGSGTIVVPVVADALSREQSP